MPFWFDYPIVDAWEHAAQLRRRVRAARRLHRASRVETAEVVDRPARDALTVLPPLEHPKEFAGVEDLPAVDAAR